MTRPAEVVPIDAARVVEERDDQPLVPIMRTANGWSERLGPSPALFYKLHRAGKLPGFRFMTNPDPKRCPLLFAEVDVLALLRREVRRRRNGGRGDVPGGAR